MALKSATTTLATIQMRRGAEENFDPDQMTAGEWAVSTDSKKVWMCFQAGLVLRMATYEAFEEDMKIIQQILEDCQDIKLAVQAFAELAEQHASQAESWSTMSKSWAVGGTGAREGEDSDNAKYYAERAKESADKAESLSDIGIMTTEKAGIGKPDGTTITVDADGTMHSVGGGGESGDFVKKSGDTMTGNLIVDKKNSDASVFIGVGSGGINHGIYSNTLGTWIAYANDKNIFLNGEAKTAIKATNDSDGKKISETYAKKSIYGDTSVSLGRKSGSTVGENSIAYGTDAIASGIRAVSLGVNNVSSGANSFSSGAYNEAVGNNAVSFGNNNTSVDSYSFSEGCGNIALGYGSHVEGAQNISGAKYVLKIASYDTSAKTFTFDDTYTGFSESFAQLSAGVRLHIANVNYINDASVYTVASVGSDGKSVVVNENIPTSNFTVYLATIIKSGGNYGGCHSEGRKNISLNEDAHSEGYMTEARGYASHTEGNLTKATSNQSHSEGYKTLSSGSQSHAEGNESVASGSNSHSEGYRTKASGKQSHAGGNYTESIGDRSFSHGFSATASAESSCAIGYDIASCNFSEFKCGKHSRDDLSGGTSNNTVGNAFVVGNGTDTTSSNAFSVTYAGVVKAKSTITASTVADYAEFFEWSDGNLEKEDRVGKFVTLEGNKIKIANSGDYILGIISGAPFVLGNGDCDMWNGAYLRDDFKRIIYEPAPLTKTDEETGEGHIVTDENGDIVFSGTRPKLNPEYDQNREYISRADRPEWDAVGMVGVLPVRDDGTCEVGKFCKCADGGIATFSTDRGIDTYMVIERVTESIVSVILK